ncbi:hypothetical protein EAG_01392 [Camponotus floridanus]|uniref:BZIP domain-containing protein n=1 Tax=Camponotus floridanus TaxID=104421 RepID=E2A365_CAMFO|nr:protein giant [Camponotus floridanus]EFN72124.1 hypothetical protein EAG_01392 [Camponotus floridanus]
MQNATNDMELKNANDLQTWDLSRRSKQGTNSESEGESKSQNYSALDLSRKNSVTSTTITDRNTLRSYLFRSMPAQQIHPNRPDQHSNLTDVEKQSPFTSDILLSSSSSESDSAKETIECIPSFYNTRSNITNNNIPLFVPPPGVTIGMPFLPLPSYLNSEAIKIPVATSTIASTFTSCAETSSLQTNRTTEKNPLEFMNVPLTQEMSTPSLEVIKKTPRPFKAYSKSSFPALKRHIDTAFTYNSSEYFEFREKMLTYKKMNENTPNPKMRRTSKTEHPGLPTSTAEEKDAAYWERRKKNNEAAKRSRDARRAKEDELAIWATFLENENTRLKSELTGLHCLLQQLGYDINQIKKYKHW